MDTDFFLIQRMKKGDDTAIDEFVRKYYPDILKYCWYHLGGNSCAEDLTQETFEKFFRSFPEYQHYGKAKNYLYVIAGNLCKNFYKKETPVPLEEISGQEEDIANAAGERVDLERALGNMPEEYREVLLFYSFQGLKQKEIADVLGIGLPLVKYRLQKAREYLKASIGEEDVHGLAKTKGRKN
ncbi:MAG: RNA polymerase sigma factor [Eubacteriales bacterium]|nr:RNA polymerase sigma factor [Eubacteriales bacterium]